VVGEKELKVLRAPPLDQTEGGILEYQMKHLRIQTQSFVLKSKQLVEFPERLATFDNVLRSEIAMKLPPNLKTSP
jgi:hypothetical protein